MLLITKDNQLIYEQNGKNWYKGARTNSKGKPHPPVIDQGDLIDWYVDGFTHTWIYDLYEIFLSKGDPRIKKLSNGRFVWHTQIYQVSTHSSEPHNSFCESFGRKDAMFLRGATDHQRIKWVFEHVEFQ